MHKSVPAVVAAALLAGILSACTVAPTVGTDVESEAEAQTLRQACDLMLPALQSMTAEMTNAFEELSSDPTQASPLLHSIGEDFRAAIDELENDDVIDVMTTAADSLDTMTAEVDRSLAGEQNEAELRAAIADVETDFSAIDTVCAP